jgi:hypothetical protein
MKILCGEVSIFTLSLISVLLEVIAMKATYREQVLENITNHRISILAVALDIRGRFLPVVL